MNNKTTIIITTIAPKEHLPTIRDRIRSQIKEGLTYGEGIMAFAKRAYYYEFYCKDVLSIIQNNEDLMGEVVFLTKQVADRDKLIQDLQELANLGIQGASYEDKV